MMTRGLKPTRAAISSWGPSVLMRGGSWSFFVWSIFVFILSSPLFNSTRALEKSDFRNLLSKGLNMPGQNSFFLVDSAYQISSPTGHRVSEQMSFLNLGLKHMSYTCQLSIDPLLEAVKIQSNRRLISLEAVDRILNMKHCLLERWHHRLLVFAKLKICLLRRKLRMWGFWDSKLMFWYVLMLNLLKNNLFWYKPRRCSDCFWSFWNSGFWWFNWFISKLIF